MRAEFFHQDQLDVTQALLPDLQRSQLDPLTSYALVACLRAYTHRQAEAFGRDEPPQWVNRVGLAVIGVRDVTLDFGDDVESVSRWGQDLNVRRATPTGKMAMAQNSL